jgi:hypothetical protein
MLVVPSLQGEASVVVPTGKSRMIGRNWPGVITTVFKCLDVRRERQGLRGPMLGRFGMRCAACRVATGQMATERPDKLCQPALTLLHKVVSFSVTQDRHGTDQNRTPHQTWE